MKLAPGVLVRIDYRNRENGKLTRGWQARVYAPRSRGVRLYRSRFFADKKWGGRTDALALATRWLSHHRKVGMCPVRAEAARTDAMLARAAARIAAWEQEAAP